MALRRRCPEAGLLHHSDQGSTYASEDYQSVLAAHGITGSMADVATITTVSIMVLCSTRSDPVMNVFMS